jgi:PP-loop superfamily ATP-utilizing enzyme
MITLTLGNGSPDCASRAVPDIFPVVPAKAIEVTKNKAALQRVRHTLINAPEMVGPDEKQR